MELWDEMERAGDMEETRDAGMDEEPVRLPRERARRYATYFAAITMVIAAASCILVVLLLHTQQETNAASNARDAALQDQLNAIEASLGSIDGAVTDGDQTAENYAALGQTVNSLRSNLTDYRDNNDIQNEEISEHLDGVIAQLDQIKEDMETAQEESDAQEEVIGTRLDSITQESSQGNSNLTQKLETVHQNIADLIDKADSAQDGNYKELKGILSATDSSLSDLVRDKFDETGSLISSNISSLRGSVDSVDKSVQGVSSSVTSGLADMRGSVDSLSTDLSAMNTSLTTNFGTVNTSMTALGTQVTSLSESLQGLDTDLGDLGSEIDDLRHARAEADESMTGHIDSLREDVTGDVQDVDARLQEARKVIAALETKIDRILKYHGIEDPAGGDDGGDGDDKPGTGGDAGSEGEDQGSGESGGSGSGTTEPETPDTGETGSAEIVTE